VAALDPANGKFLWKIDVSGGASICSPAAHRSLLLIEKYNQGLAMYRTGGAEPYEELWRRPEIKPSYAQALVADGKVYVFFKGLTCLDGLTGKELAQIPCPGHPGTMLGCQGFVFWQVGTTKGKGAKVKIAQTRPEGQGLAVLGELITPIPTERDPAWTHPTIYGGRLYVRIHEQMAVYDLQNLEKKGLPKP
jgi:hypothetical protein